MIDIDEAFGRYPEALSPLPPEERPLAEALGRVLAGEVRSPVDLPPFPQSSMDGYALRAADTRDAGPDSPARLRLAGTRAAGPAEGADGAALPVDEGEAVRIFTGGLLPEGADAVLRQEEARVEDGVLEVRGPVAAGTAVRDRGEELGEGTPLAGGGVRLTAGHVAGLAAAGVSRLPVRPAPRIALFTTGDEVVPAGGDLRPGQVFDANAPLVDAWLRSLGHPGPETAHLPDDPGETEAALDAALERADLVLTAGGVSVGDRDFVIEAAERAGVRRAFWRVRQKPGKPLYFGVRDGTPLLGLPGNPGSVHACLPTHVRRVLDLLEGTASPGPRFLRGRLAADFELNPAREWWARCRTRVDGDGLVWLEPLRGQASHMIAALGRCGALARLPRGEGRLDAGRTVRWVRAAGAGLEPGGREDGPWPG